MDEYCFDTGTVTLNYAAAGSGPAVVLLHGGSSNWQHLGSLVDGLAEHWRVYAPDLRGHGKSGRKPWWYAVRDYAQDIAAFLAQVSGPAYVFGHSLGGIVAVMTAAQHPENVRALLVGDSPLDAATWQAVLQNGRGKLESWRALSGGAIPVEEIMERLKDAPADPTGDSGPPPRMREVYPEGHIVYRYLAERLYEQDPDVLGILLDDYDDAARGYEMERLLPAIRCPVLLMQADPSAGGVMTDAEVQRALPLLKQPSHIFLTGLSHILHIQDAPRMLRVMEEYLATLPSLPGGTPAARQERSG